VKLSGVVARPRSADTNPHARDMKTTAERVQERLARRFDQSAFILCQFVF